MKDQVILETEQLYMRWLQASDLEQLALLDSDQDVLHFINGGKPLSRQEVQESLAIRLEKQRQNPGFGIFANILKDTSVLDGKSSGSTPESLTGQFTGWTCLKELDTSGKIEVGYRFHKKFWGMGLASESAKAALDYGFQTMKCPLICGVTRPDHKVSQHVLQKIGLKPKGTEFHYKMDLSYFELTLDEWRLAQSAG